jgi:xanthine dehydrogenase accessory factor
MKNPDQSSLFVVAEKLLDQQTPAALVKIIRASGSTPRDAGTLMLVTKNAIFGTVGGGRLEYMACDEAMDLIESNKETKTIEIPLGPDIGQCCGGKVALSFSRLKQTDLKMIKATTTKEPYKSVQIHGAGHTGRALCNALALLPFKTEIVDTRANVWDGLPNSIIKTHLSLPEACVKSAPANTAFVIFTHDHHLDFLIAAEALNRKDAAYVGMIGSKTKRAVFKNWLKQNGYDADIAKGLVSPIGSSVIKDKRPEIIAALVSAELINIFSDRK